MATSVRTKAATAAPVDLVGHALCFDLPHNGSLDQWEKVNLSHFLTRQAIQQGKKFLPLRVAQRGLLATLVTPDSRLDHLREVDSRLEALRSMTNFDAG